MSKIDEQIAAIDRALEDGTYKPGRWQRLVAAVEALPQAERNALAPRMTSLSDKLHGRNGFVQVPFVAAYGAEWVLLFAGLLLVLTGGGSPWISLAGVVALLLCMQPFIKVTVGLILGVRYSYGFLWYVEPRFKMSYGTYLMLGSSERVQLHLAGSIGTPLAALLGYLLVDPTQTLLVSGCQILFWLMLVLQIATFFAEWFGVRKVGPFRLSLLTSPATAAMELRKRG